MKTDFRRDEGETQPGNSIRLTVSAAWVQNQDTLDQVDLNHKEKYEVTERNVHKQSRFRVADSVT